MIVRRAFRCSAIVHDDDTVIEVEENFLVECNETEQREAFRNVINTRVEMMRIRIARRYGERYRNIDITVTQSGTNGDQVVNTNEPSATRAEVQAIDRALTSRTEQ